MNDYGIPLEKYAFNKLQQLLCNKKENNLFRFRLVFPFHGINTFLLGVASEIR